ncbi:MAG: hypothetical protein ACI9P5_002000 [Saprospiraceae bacterium]|mgnify:CR=1 FL=1|jgi:hypothetical protein|tara:strand:- start:42 stop:572 length:531 start_codon:yes stop_codon:yes gene_type:complete
MFGNSGSNEMCAHVLTACGAPGYISVCKTVILIGGEDHEIIGETETCYGNTYEYSLSNPDDIVSYDWFIDPTEDSFIIGSNTEPTVTVGFSDDPVQFSGEICVTYKDVCGYFFTECLDNTPNHYIRQLRFSKAIEYLETSDYNVSEICYRVGFSDPNYFSRVFSQEFGRSPSRFRQ